MCFDFQFCILNFYWKMIKIETSYLKAASKQNDGIQSRSKKIGMIKFAFFCLLGSIYGIQNRFHMYCTRNNIFFITLKLKKINNSIVLLHYFSFIDIIINYYYLLYKIKVSITVENIFLYFYLFNLFRFLVWFVFFWICVVS